MRQPINSERLNQFLNVLGKEVNFPCKIYLVGGTSLIVFGLREQTVDIDLSLEVDNKYHAKLIQTIRHLKEELDMNIEEASPGDFIPLPSGWEERCSYVGQFGTITVYHFDLYSTALSKIERGSEIDFEDVKSLIQSGKIEWKKLIAFYQEILPRYGNESLKQDPARIKRNFDILKHKSA